MAQGTVYGNRLVGKVSIKNNAPTDFHGKLRIQIWSQKNGQNTAWSGSSRTILCRHRSMARIASVDFDFDGLSDGYKYRFQSTTATKTATSPMVDYGTMPGKCTADC